MGDLLERPGSRPVLEQPGVHMGVNAPTWPAAGPEVEHEPRIVDDEPAEAGWAQAHSHQKGLDPRQQIPVHALRLALLRSCSVPYCATGAVGNPL
jgi:hypothetical protein